jgi:hypothetical protein
MKTIYCLMCDDVEGTWKWLWSIGHINPAFAWKNQGKKHENRQSGSWVSQFKI